MTRKQMQIVGELKAVFCNATVDVVDHSAWTGKVLVFMSVVAYSCQGDYLRNKFEIGPRGGLKIVRQEFDASY